MFPMNDSKRACEDHEKIDAFLSAARVGHLGLTDGAYPYVVPVNYCWHDGRIYFHGADTGKKVEIIKNNPHVCFTVCEELGTIADPVPAQTDTGYMSVMVFGQIERVEGIKEMTGVMQVLLDKYVPGYYDRPLSQHHVSRYRSSMGSSVAVFCITPDAITAKDNPLPEEMRFYPGRTVKLDS
ncbi:pyridoxamine 5'-phosphate oxidase family protein [Brevibacillus nitrificans]|uniref:pyridoxamine 5'-phosphate oxidase family protein n=1 Tax=Brevibacillus nitrificans TaxID=651560 RepID=UPI00262B8F9D|nr:pyridoxamine 5'-phosphate oxidase family protein [Brevibacillus nitrificans]